MLYLVTVRFSNPDEGDATAIADHLREYLQSHYNADRIEDLEVRTQPFVRGGASDPGPAFDRTAGRITVDVTEPGGAIGLDGRSYE